MEEEEQEKDQEEIPTASHRSQVEVQQLQAAVASCRSLHVERGGALVLFVFVSDLLPSL